MGFGASMMWHGCLCLGDGAWFIVVGSCLMGHGSSVLGIGVESWMMGDGCWVMGDWAWAWALGHVWWCMGDGALGDGVLVMELGHW